MRVAVLSDVHANQPALEAVLADVADVAVDELWFLGDLVGYGARPSACLDLIRRHATVALAGNHDLACVHGEPAAAGASGQQVAGGPILRSLQWARDCLSPDQMHWLSELEPSATPRPGLSCFHGSPRDPAWEFVSSRTTAKLCLQARPDDRLILVGHTHLPMAFRAPTNRAKIAVKPFAPDHLAQVRLNGYRCLLNPGAVGRRQDDGDGRASWMLLDFDDQRATWRRVDYPALESLRQAAAAGLTTCR